MPRGLRWQGFLKKNTTWNAPHLRSKGAMKGGDYFLKTLWASEASECRPCHLKEHNLPIRWFKCNGGIKIKSANYHGHHGRKANVVDGICYNYHLLKYGNYH